MQTIECSEIRSSIDQGFTSLFDEMSQGHSDRYYQSMSENAPEWLTSLGNDDQQLCSRIEKAIRRRGIAIVYCYDIEQEGISWGGRIDINNGLDKCNKFIHYIHEYVHELIHWPKPILETEGLQEELQSEGTSYVVTNYFGIYNPFSRDYLLTLGGTPEILLQQKPIITQTAEQIILELKSIS